jgi:hypothetical protein
MTIGLAVAALALVAAIVYLTLSKRRGSEDPADVKAGQAQKSYDDEPQAPTATATASAKAPPKPKGNWPSKGGKKKESDDFYDHL